MRVALPIYVGLSIVLAAAACGGGQAAPPPEPVVNQDSIDAARRRQQEVADSIAREQARRDSLARAQQESERMRRQRDDSLANAGRDAEAVRAMVARAVHFDFDRAEVRPGDDASILEEKLRILQANPGLSIEVTGHADERGSDEYNLALGNRRAIAAKGYLTTRGIDPSRVSTRSMGEEQPLDPGHTEDAWTQNRRGEFTITAGGGTLRRP